MGRGVGGIKGGFMANVVVGKSCFVFYCCDKFYFCSFPFVVVNLEPT